MPLTNQGLDNLEKRIFDFLSKELDEIRHSLLSEKINQLNDIDVSFMICDKDTFHYYEDSFFPICEEDLIFMKDRSFKIDESDFYEVGLVCIPFPDKIKDAVSGFQYEGCVISEGNQYKATFRLIRETKYRSAAEELVNQISSNHIGHFMLNKAYLDCFFKLYAIIDQKQPLKGKIVDSFSCDFNLYQDYILPNCMPVWNVKQSTLQSNYYPILQENKLYYKYEFQFPSNSKWIPNISSEFEGYSSCTNSLVNIYARNPYMEHFPFYQILPITKEFDELTNHIRIQELEYLFPIMNSSKSEKVIYTQNINSMYLTEASLIQELSSFQISQFLRFEKFEIMKSQWESLTEQQDVIYTYQGNEQHEVKDVICCFLTFKKVHCSDFIAEGVLRFLLTQLSYQYPKYEYRAMILE